MSIYDDVHAEAMADYRACDFDFDYDGPDASDFDDEDRELIARATTAARLDATVRRVFR